MPPHLYAGRGVKSDDHFLVEDDDAVAGFNSPNPFPPGGVNIVAAPDDSARVPIDAPKMTLI